MLQGTFSIESITPEELDLLLADLWCERVFVRREKEAAITIAAPSDVFAQARRIIESYIIPIDDVEQTSSL